MYTLLAGSPPFWHRKQMLMLRMIMDGQYQFGSPEWDDYSDTVKDLVRGHAHLLPRCQGRGKHPNTQRQHAQSAEISRRDSSLYLSHCCSKIPSKSNLRKEGVYSGSGFMAPGV